MFDLVFRRISSEPEGDGKLWKSLQILMQFETESAAKADGGDIIATNTISLQRRYKIWYYQVLLNLWVDFWVIFLWPELWAIRMKIRQQLQMPRRSIYRTKQIWLGHQPEAYYTSVCLSLSTGPLFDQKAGRVETINKASAQSYGEFSSG